MKGRKINLQKIPLKTVRQFFIQDVVLTDYEDCFTPDTPQVTKKVEDFCYAKVTERLINDVALISLYSAQPHLFLCHFVGHRDAGGSREG